VHLELRRANKHHIWGSFLRATLLHMCEVGCRAVAYACGGVYLAVQSVVVSVCETAPQVESGELELLACRYMASGAVVILRYK